MGEPQAHGPESRPFTPKPSLQAFAYSALTTCQRWLSLPKASKFGCRIWTGSHRVLSVTVLLRTVQCGVVKSFPFQPVGTALHDVQYTCSRTKSQLEACRGAMTAHQQHQVKSMNGPREQAWCETRLLLSSGEILGKHSPTLRLNFLMCISG